MKKISKSDYLEISSKEDVQIRYVPTNENIDQELVFAQSDFGMISLLNVMDEDYYISDKDYKKVYNSK